MSINVGSLQLLNLVAKSLHPIAEVTLHSGLTVTHQHKQATASGPSYLAAAMSHLTV